MPTLPNPQSPQSDLQLEIAHLLLIDMVGYSQLLVNEQVELVQELNRIVRETNCFRTAESSGRLIRVPTGDGMALLFFRSPEEPARCALEIAERLKEHPRVRLRMGIHSGPVNIVQDVNDQTNVAGAGINIAQRVMDCGDAGHILLSKRIADDLAQYRQWQPFLHDFGECEVKHGLRLQIANLYKDGLGNPVIPEKLRRRHRWRQDNRTAVKPVSAPRWPVILLIVVILLTLSTLAVSLWNFLAPRFKSAVIAEVDTAPLIPEKSIAVLPFESLSDEKEHAYFADGVQDEILTDLAKVADLKVTSRTSVMQYKSGAERNLRDIAKQLGVAHVLEGTVQTIGNRVRVRAQLIDARTDTHLWAEGYERDIADVFTVESELAQKIVAELKSKMSPQEKTAIEEQPTSDLAAYDSYSRAKAIVGTASLTVGEKEKFLEAERLLNEAIARDPAFFLAYCRLARLHDRIYILGIDHTPARLALADKAIKSAMRLRPDAGDVHLALAVHLYSGYRDYDRARDELKAAQRSLPNESFIFELTGYIERRRGRWDDCITNLQRALTLDPRNRNLWVQLSLAHQNLRRFGDMATSLERAMALAPDDPGLRVQHALVDLEARGDVAALHAAIQTESAENPKAAPDIARTWLYLALCERDYAAAETALALMTADECRQEGVPFPSGWCRAVVARAKGDSAAARAAFTDARLQLEKIVKEQANYAEALCALGLVDAGLGNQDQAVSEGRRAVDLLPVSKDAINGPLLVEYLALIYAWTGDRARAVEQLSIAATIPSDISYGQLKLHPYWDVLRGDPRFEQLVRSLAPK